MKNFLAAFFALCLLSAPALAQSGQVAFTGMRFGYGILVATTTATTISGAAAQIQFDTLSIDTFGICTTATVCTPTVAGKYFVTCQVDISMTTGPAVGSLDTALQIRKNGAALPAGGSANIYAQTASVSGARVLPQANAIISVNGSSDTFSCVALSQGTSPVMNVGVNTNWLNYEYLGP